MAAHCRAVVRATRAKASDSGHTGRKPMAGMFELFNDEESNFRFRITGPDGAVMATSRAFPDKRSAVAGIRDMREYAGMGHITDVCPLPVARAVLQWLH